MVIARTVKKVRRYVAGARRKAKRIGFVPTMGALHQGHLSLVRAAKRENDFVVVSIFVNPTQFVPGEDYRSYPRDFKGDKELLATEGADILFAPTPQIMYGKNCSTYVDEIRLSKYLCGRRRIGHFRGVCSVVAKLFNIVEPDISYFGRKDYQQAQIVKRMARDLHFPVTIKVLPIVRERGGLAMSSRNKYLNREKREKATVLYRSLRLADKRIKAGERNSQRVVAKMRALIMKEAPGVKIEYINVVDPSTLKDVAVIRGRIVVALAVSIGKARLIDNIVISKR